MLVALGVIKVVLIIIGYDIVISMLVGERLY